MSSLCQCSDTISTLTEACRCELLVFWNDAILVEETEGMREGTLRLADDLQENVSSFALELVLRATPALWHVFSANSYCCIRMQVSTALDPPPAPSFLNAHSNVKAPGSGSKTYRAHVGLVPDAGEAERVGGGAAHCVHDAAHAHRATQPRRAHLVPQQVHVVRRHFALCASTM